jgi:hypothetical protein
MGSTVMPSAISTCRSEASEVRRANLFADFLVPGD